MSRNHPLPDRIRSQPLPAMRLERPGGQHLTCMQIVVHIILSVMSARLQPFAASGVHCIVSSAMPDWKATTAFLACSWGRDATGDATTGAHMNKCLSSCLLFRNS